MTIQFGLTYSQYVPSKEIQQVKAEDVKQLTEELTVNVDPSDWGNNLDDELTGGWASKEPQNTVFLKLANRNLTINTMQGKEHLKWDSKLVAAALVKAGFSQSFAKTVSDGIESLIPQAVQLNPHINEGTDAQPKAVADVVKEKTAEKNKATQAEQLKTRDTQLQTLELSGEEKELLKEAKNNPAALSVNSSTNLQKIAQLTDLFYKILQSENVDLFNEHYLALKDNGFKLNFSYANFDGLNLSGVNFSGANLANASFAGSNLSNSNFEKIDSNRSNVQINFTNANLSNANITNSSFYSTSFAGANLTGANMSGSTAHNCNFTKTQMENTEFPRELSQSDFTGATGLTLTQVQQIQRNNGTI